MCDLGINGERNVADKRDSVYDRAFAMRIYVHDMLFRETISAQGTPQQFQQWRQLCDELNIIGCFAMTELGHRRVSIE